MTEKEQQLVKELNNALQALALCRNRLIEAQEELRRLKWILLKAEEGKGAAS